MTATTVPRVTGALLASLTTGGVVYAFGLYGAALKRSLRLSQAQLDTVASAGFCAGLLSWLPGLCVDRWGPRRSLAAGGALSAAHLLLFWAVARGFLPVARVVPALSAVGVGVFLSSAMIIGSVFKVLVTSCGPGSKGAVVGVAKGYVGLGAGTYACLFDALRASAGSDLDFLPMAALLAVGAATVPALLLLPPKRGAAAVPDALTAAHFAALYAGLAALAAAVGWASLAVLVQGDASARAAREGPRVGFAALVLGVWVGPILLLLRLPRGAGAGGRVQSADAPSEATPLIAESVAGPRTGPGPGSGQDHRSLGRVVRTPEAWLLFWSCAVLVGGGTLMTNNMGQMVESLRFAPATASASLALFSVAQAASRVATGAVSEWALPRGVPRPFFLVVASLAAAAAHAVLALSTRLVPFVTGVALSGVAFGMAWPLMVLIVGEVFGSAHVGANYMFYDGATSAFGTVLLSKLVAQEVYEAHVRGGGLTCVGGGCFCMSHVAVAGLSLASVVTSGALLRATRHVYC